MASKVIFNFLGGNGATWTEDYWTAVPPQSATALLDATLKLRLALLGKPHKLTRIEWRDTEAGRIGNKQDVFKFGTRVDSGVPVPSYQPVSTAIVYQVTAANGAKRRIWIRGITDDSYSIGAAGSEQLSTGVNDLILAWFNKLGSLNYGIRRMTPVPLRPPNIVNLTSIDGSAGGASVVTCASPHGLTASPTQEIVIYRTSAKDVPHLNGHWFVSAVGPNPPGTTFTIPYVTPRNQGPIPITGFVRKVAWDTVSNFQQDIGWKLLQIRHHDSREQVFGSRGRAHAARLRTTP